MNLDVKNMTPKSRLVFPNPYPTFFPLTELHIFQSFLRTSQLRSSCARFAADEGELQATRVVVEGQRGQAVLKQSPIL